MTVIESITRKLEKLSVREQIQVASFIARLNPRVNDERSEELGRLFGILSEEDGKAFEEALRTSRRVEPNA